jgi:quercetin dioxygenase-like cupin family protein
VYIVHHALLPHLQHAGEQRVAAVDRGQGIGAFQVAVCTLEAGAHTAPQQHGGELAVVCLSGAGKLIIHGGPQRFHGPCSLVIPPCTPYELANQGTLPLQLVCVFTDAPVAAEA